MNKPVAREAIFFVLVFLLFFLAVEGIKYLGEKTQLSDNVRVLLVGAGYTLAIVGVFYLANLKGTKDNYQGFPLGYSPNMCKGGSYLYQGDSPFAKMCQAAEKTPEGRCAIASANCAGPGSMKGAPRNFPLYTSNSNSCWKATDCSCNKQPGKSCGLCS